MQKEAALRMIIEQYWLTLHGVPHLPPFESVVK